MEKCIEKAQELIEELKNAGADEALIESAMGLHDEIKEEYEEDMEEGSEGEDKPEEEKSPYDNMSDKDLEEKAYEHMGKEEEDKKGKPHLVIAIGMGKKK